MQIADENRQSTRIRQWRWVGTWDCGDADLRLIRPPSRKARAAAGTRMFPLTPYPLKPTSPICLLPQSSLYRSTREEGSLVVGLLINFPVTVV